MPPSGYSKRVCDQSEYGLYTSRGGAINDPVAAAFEQLRIGARAPREHTRKHAKTSISANVEEGSELKIRPVRRDLNLHVNFTIAAVPTLLSLFFA